MARQNNKYPTSFQREILMRALGEAGVASLYEQYQGARKNRIYAREPSQKDIRAANVAKKVGFKAASRELGISVAEVYSAFGRTAKWNFYQSKD